MKFRRDIPSPSNAGGGVTGNSELHLKTGEEQRFGSRAISHARYFGDSDITASDKQRLRIITI